MKLLKSMMVAMTLLLGVSCNWFDEGETFPPITSLDHTDWYWVGELPQEEGDTEKRYIYYTLSFLGDSQGRLVSSDAKEDGNILKESLFTYSFINPGLSVEFYDGGRYQGYVVPKGEIKVDYKDVYLIQLFGVDEDGMPILNERGEYADTMLFWRE